MLFLWYFYILHNHCLLKFKLIDNTQHNYIFDKKGISVWISEDGTLLSMVIHFVIAALKCNTGLRCC